MDFLRKFDAKKSGKKPLSKCGLVLLFVERLFQFFHVYIFDDRLRSQLLDLSDACILTLSFSSKFSFKSSNCHDNIF